MCAEYTALGADLKALTQETGTTQITLPMAENAWNSRPDADSWGIYSCDFEADNLYGDNVKVETAWEGSVDLYSRDKHGSGWVAVITGTLTEHCDGCWSLNSHSYERETGLFHWEWTFQIEG